MNIIIIVVAVTAGVILGGTAIYVYQGKCRQKELQLPVSYTHLTLPTKLEV